MQICLKDMDDLEHKMDDFIRLEESWNSVKAATVTSIMGLKGVFSFLEPTGNGADRESNRSSSIASASGAVFRRLSNAFSSVPQSSRTSSVASGSYSASQQNDAAFNRNGSVSSVNSVPVYRTPNYVRNQASQACPTSMPASSNFAHHTLSTIPPTPALDEMTDPFDTNDAPPVPTLPEVVASS